jgi:hypothetical protein
VTVTSYATPQRSANSRTLAWLGMHHQRNGGPAPSTGYDIAPAWVAPSSLNVTDPCLDEAAFIGQLSLAHAAFFTETAHCFAKRELIRLSGHSLDWIRAHTGQLLVK